MAPYSVLCLWCGGVKSMNGGPSAGLVLASLLLTRAGHCPGKQNVCPASPAQPSPAAGPGRPTPHCWPGLAGATRLDCRHCSFVNPEVYSLSPLIFYTLPFSFNHVCFLARGLLAFNLFSLCLVKELSQISQRESSRVIRHRHD